MLRPGGVVHGDGRAGDATPGGVRCCGEAGLQSNKEGRGGNKVFRSEALPREIAKDLGREGSGVGRDAQPRRQQPGH